MTSPSAPARALPAIIAALRDATGEAHARLDAGNQVLTPGLDLAAYHELIGRYLVAHRAVEAALEPWGAILSQGGVTLDERRKLPLLQRDRAFTASLLGSDSGKMDPEAALTLPSLAAAWGALYVAEGSTLGGQHILRSLQSSDLVRSHGLTPDHGLAYFSGYGDRTASMWRQLMTALDNADTANPAMRAAMIHGAQSTFELFERVLVRQ